MDTYKKVIFEPNGVLDCKVTATLEDNSTKQAFLPNVIVKAFFDLCLNSMVI